MSKHRGPPRRIWALFDAQGEMVGTYGTRGEADTDAVGPRFRPGYSVRAHDLAPVREVPAVKEGEG